MSRRGLSRRSAPGPGDSWGIAGLFTAPQNVLAAMCDPALLVFTIGARPCPDDAPRKARTAVGQTLILLHPPPP